MAHDRESARHQRRQARAAEKPIEQMAHFRGDGIVRQIQDDNARVVRRRIIADIGKVEVTSHQNSRFGAGKVGNLPVGRRSKANLASMDNVMTLQAHNGHGRSWEIRIKQEFHRGPVGST